VEDGETFWHLDVMRNKGACHVDEQKKLSKDEREEFELSIHMCLRTVDLILGHN
jgi:hypothetical protein